MTFLKPAISPAARPVKNPHYQDLAVLEISRDFTGILIYFDLFWTGMGKWYLKVVFDFLISSCELVVRRSPR